MRFGSFFPRKKAGGSEKEKGGGAAGTGWNWKNVGGYSDIVKGSVKEIP